MHYGGDIKILKDYIRKNKNGKIRIYFDIETLQYNEEEGRKKPSKFKNITYSVCIGIDHEYEITTYIFPNWKEIFDLILTELRTKKGICKCKSSIELIAHNNNRYDNHFLLQDLRYYYKGIRRYNRHLNNAIENDDAYKVDDLTDSDKMACVLEERIKTSNNLRMRFYLFGVCFDTVDNYPKTNLSIKTLGKKLLNINALTNDNLKTDFDYVQFNRPFDMEDDIARDYALQIFENLTDENKKYIHNDVIILANSVKNFDKLFPDFNYVYPTFMSNVVKAYNDNNITSYQLLNKINNFSEKLHVQYTNYRICGQNFYDFLKSFYRGGLNFYNYKFINEIQYGKFFSIDINSSYPYVMYAFNIPTFLESYQEFNEETKVVINAEKDILENRYTLYRVEKDYFNTILKKIKSMNMRKILVKYYNGNEHVNINTYTIKILQDICKLKIRSLRVIGCVSYQCIPFGSKDKIEKYYQYKCQGKLKNEIVMETPMEYVITDKPMNAEIYTNEEVYISKVFLNGIYGAPALRAYFNLFRLNDAEELHNIPNGFKNAERNIVFSVFVTSVALYNLLSPLKHLSAYEIDEYFLYADTDSLYFNYKIFDKIPKDMFDPIALGKWGIQEKEGIYIEKFFVLNHKKYAYQTSDGKIKVACGGIRGDSFDLNMSFEKFIETQFSDGVEVENIKNINNEQGTISIYNSSTKIEKGIDYKTEFSIFDDYLKELMLHEIREKYKDGIDDMMYIESNLGSFSVQDIFEVKHEYKEKSDLFILDVVTKRIKKIIEKSVDV